MDAEVEDCRLEVEGVFQKLKKYVSQVDSLKKDNERLKKTLREFQTSLLKAQEELRESKIKNNPVICNGMLNGDSELNLKTKKSRVEEDHENHDVGRKGSEICSLKNPIMAITNSLVLDNILSRLNNAMIQNCRLVCKDWNDMAIRVLARQNNGMGPGIILQDGLEQVKTKQLEKIEELHLMMAFAPHNLFRKALMDDNSLDKKGFYKMLINSGHLLRSIKVTSEFLRWVTLRRILIEWCPNLEELDLNYLKLNPLDYLGTNEVIHSRLLQQLRILKLTTLSVNINWKYVVNPPVAVVAPGPLVNQQDVVVAVELDEPAEEPELHNSPEPIELDDSIDASEPGNLDQAQPGHELNPVRQEQLEPVAEPVEALEQEGPVQIEGAIPVQPLEQDAFAEMEPIEVEQDHESVASDSHSSDDDLFVPGDEVLFNEQNPQEEVTVGQFMSTSYPMEDKLIEILGTIIGVSPNLKHLLLKGNGAGGTAKLLHRIRCFPEVTKQLVSISMCGSNTRGNNPLKELYQLELSSRLKHLTITSGFEEDMVPKEELVQILEKVAISLNTLSLVYNNSMTIDSAMLTAIPKIELPQMNNLTTFKYLADVAFQIRSIDFLAKMPNLKILYISGSAEFFHDANNFPDRLFSNFKLLKERPHLNLQELYFYGPIESPALLFQRMKVALPNLSKLQVCLSPTIVPNEEVSPSDIYWNYFNDALDGISAFQGIRVLNLDFNCYRQGIGKQGLDPIGWKDVFSHLHKLPNLSHLSIHYLDVYDSWDMDQDFEDDIFPWLGEVYCGIPKLKKLTIYGFMAELEDPMSKENELIKWMHDHGIQLEYKEDGLDILFEHQSYQDYVLPSVIESK